MGVNSNFDDGFLTVTITSTVNIIGFEITLANIANGNEPVGITELTDSGLIKVNKITLYLFLFLPLMDFLIYLNT